MAHALRRGARGTQGGAAFDPLDSISWATAFWAEDPDWSEPADGGAVSSWRDAGTNAVDLGNQGNPARNATYRASTAAYNNKPTVEGGVNTALRQGSAFTGVSPPFTIVVVGNVAVTGSKYITSWAGSTYLVRNTTDWAIANTTYRAIVAGDLNPHVFVITIDGASTTVRIDGSSTSLASPGTTQASRFMLFADGGSAGQGQGHIPFLGFYAGSLAGASVTAFEDWASAYYGTP